MRRLFVRKPLFCKKRRATRVVGPDVLKLFANDVDPPPEAPLSTTWQSRPPGPIIQRSRRFFPVRPHSMRLARRCHPSPFGPYPWQSAQRLKKPPPRTCCRASSAGREVVGNRHDCCLIIHVANISSAFRDWQMSCLREGKLDYDSAVCVPDLKRCGPKFASRALSLCAHVR